MPTTIQRSYRLTPESVERIEQLRTLWSQAKPLSAASVINEAISRAWEAEKSPEAAEA
jgi:hypothetical protein